MYAITPPSNNPFTSQFRFMNIRHLGIYFPVDATFMSIILRFDQLVSLKVTPYDSNHDFDYYAELQALLDRAPLLYSLIFRCWSRTSARITPIEYSNSSVRRLDVQNIDQCYNPEQCVALIRSSWALQCQVLCIAVENRLSILDLINAMTQLRLLNVLCQDDPWNTDEHNQSSSKEDELIGWLQHHVPATFAIVRNAEKSFNYDFKSCYSILIWIG
ncbi:unnamed protein product [Rotaria sp. Silwood1]|nr:unnamed protein product [Rotaria sp. Silwood1]